MLWVPLITGLAIVLIIIQMQLREHHQAWSVLISTTFTIVIVLILIPQLEQVIGLFNNLSAQAGVSIQYLAPVLKTIGIAYVSSLGAEVCRDADENAMATAVELAGKIVMLLVAMPVIQAILTAVLGIIG